MYRPAEIKAVTSITGGRIVPPNTVPAPQGIGKPQPLSSLQTPITEFRRNLPPTTMSKDAVGTHVNEAEKEAPRNRNITNPYEWDINKPVAQPEPLEVKIAEPVKEMAEEQEQAADVDQPKQPVKKVTKAEPTESKPAKETKDKPVKSKK
jgi:hypothetical protein